jgi:hypothetical protein
MACDVALEAPHFVELSPRTLSATEFDQITNDGTRLLIGDSANTRIRLLH